MAALDSLIRLMVSEGGYSCADLYGCWQAAVETYWSADWRTNSAGDTVRRNGGSLLDRFLQCAGTKFCSAAPYSEKITGSKWLLNAWKVLPLSPLASTVESCSLAVGYDAVTWVCDTTDSVEINDRYRQLRSCMAAIDRATVADSEAIKMQEFASVDNPYYKKVETTFTRTDVANYFKGMTDTCVLICESRRENFRDSVVRMYNKLGYWVEGYLTKLPVGTPKPDTIRSSRLACMVSMLVEECKDQCSFPVEWEVTSTNPNKLVRPNADDLKEYQAARYSLSFRVQEPMQGDTCPSDMWKRVERSVVLADLIVDVLNRELELYRAQPGATVSRWNARPIIERLAIEFPQISLACLPPRDTANVVEVDGPWTFTVDATKESRFFVSRSNNQCKIMYEPPKTIIIENPYGPANPHPLVTMLNNYIEKGWGRNVHESYLDGVRILDSLKTTSFYTNNDDFTYYRVDPDTDLGDTTAYLAQASDPLKPIFACDEDGRWYRADTIQTLIVPWELCPEEVTCINGKTILLSHLGQQVKFLSTTRRLVRMNPDDDSLRVYGDIEMSFCRANDQAANFKFSITVAVVDSTIRIGWTLPGGQSAQQSTYQWTTSKAEWNKFIDGRAFLDSVGRFVQTWDGRLAFRLTIDDTVRYFTYDNCISFECSRIPPADTCLAVPVCNICDTVNCGAACFRWVPSDTIAPTQIFKSKSCAADELDRIISTIEQQLSECLERKKIDVDISFDTTCFNPRKINDRFIARRGETFYHYTLYYYDRAGNLIRTVPPSGFKPLTTAQIRLDTNSHTMATSYAYNSIGQLVEQFTPDGGITKFWYDNVGRLRLSQNARQAASSKYSYTNYDALGRVVEVGQQSSSTIGTPSSHVLTQAQTTSGTHRIITTYSVASSLPSPYVDTTQRNLRNRVSKTASDQDGNLSTVGDLVESYYSYDAHGNVEWLLQAVPALAENANPLVAYIGYDYDLISGKVRQVHYRPEQKDAFHHRYVYDHDGRVTKAETSVDAVVWTNDAAYAYETHGPLRRIELGQDHVQGTDYTYTINGWLKAINHASVNPIHDPGKDGMEGANPLTGRDAFGMFLGYHTDDFKHTNSLADAATTMDSSNSWHHAPLSSLYNGNIGAWAWSARAAGGAPVNLASRYRYDVLNRIRTDTLSTRASAAWTATPNFRSSYMYDGNGNLQTLLRVDSAGTLMDSLRYKYQTGKNRLTHVDDPGGVASNHSYDIDDQDTNNYTYDASGNLITDVQSGITEILWTPSNKIEKITKGSTSKLEYTYDAMGNRVVKRYYKPANTLKHTTWYVRDAQGNIMSVYERPTATSAIKQTEVHIYGSSRLGIEQRDITYSIALQSWFGREIHRNAGSKRYELTDHLGNVRITISDIIVPRNSGYATQDAEVMDRRDYYPFGMEMPERRWRALNEDATRFGFNGKENDNEVKGEGNQQDYGFRIYDPRVGRFLSVDPLSSKYPTWSPYQIAGCSPIALVDREGDEWEVAFIGRNDPRGRFLALIMTIFSNKVKASIDNNKVTLHFVGNNTLQSMDAYQQAAYNSLNEVITSTTTTMHQEIVSVYTDVTIDSYGTMNDMRGKPKVDVHDLQSIGRIMGDNRYSAALLVHSVVEAFSKYKDGPDYPASHAKGKIAEGPIIGMDRFGTLGSDGGLRIDRGDGTANGVLEGLLSIPYIKNGVITSLEIGITNGAVSSAQIVPGNTTPSNGNTPQGTQGSGGGITVSPALPGGGSGNSQTPPPTPVTVPPR